MNESPYTAEDRQRWKQRLLDKGQEISKKLEQVLAKKDVSLDDLKLKLDDDEKEPKEKRLRRYFDLIMARLRKVESSSFGFDRQRGAFLSVAELDEMPWIDTDS